MFVDTHAHVNFKGFAEDAESVIQRALENGVSVVNVGTQISTSRQAVEMAEKFENLNSKSETNSNNQNLNSKPKVYTVVGLHPVHTYSQELDEEETHFKTREEKFNYEEYKKLAQSPLVVGIGECGLDYFRLEIKDERLKTENIKQIPDGAPRGIDRVEGTGYKVEVVKQLQKEAFIEQIKLALELDKALVIHTRASKGTDDACLDVLNILISNFQSQLPTLRFVLHSYTSSPETAQKFIDLGAYISFNGILTFDKTGNQEAVLKLTPNDRILLETDCPYLTPVPHRGKKNEPVFVKHVAEKVAEIKGLSLKLVEEITTENAKRFYKIN
jgi:TatD DNase family protein